MPVLSASVGEAVGTKGSNKRHDVAVVQLLLATAKHPKTGKVYYSSKYDGLIGKTTTDAIKAFQESWNLAAPPAPAGPKTGTSTVGKVGTSTAGKPGTPTPVTTPAATAATDKHGLIELSGKTFDKLVEQAVKVTPDFSRLRGIPGTKALYLEGTDVDLKARRKEIEDSGLEATFKKNVLALVDTMFTTHKIVLGGWNTKDSFLRTFADQSKSLKDGSSPAHPGESLHQYGLGMDVGWRGMVWIQDDGTPSTINNVNDWDAMGKRGYWRQNAYYDARNKLWEIAPRGTGTIYKLETANDPDHFQAYSQTPSYYPKATVVSMAVSLAALLTKVSKDRGDDMKWEVGGQDHHYTCDLGLGGAQVAVGSADLIWKGKASLTKGEYVKAKNAVLAKTKQPLVKDADVPKEEYEKVFNALKQAFDDAEKDGPTKWVALDKTGTAI